jgi:metal-responsive CopG/Arc/MetJ family transcriptional regulator
LTSGKYSEAQVTVRKHPVSIALSNRVLEKIDKEASKQKRSRSEYVELHFETLFFKQPKTENLITLRTA